MRSLASKLTLAFLLVSVVGTLLVVLVVRWQTERQFDRYVQDRYEDELVYASQQLAGYYERQGAWDGISGVAIREVTGLGNEGGDGPRRGGRSDDPMRRVALADGSGRILTGGGNRFRVGTQATAAELRRATPITVEGQVVGYLLLSSDLPDLPPDSPELLFLGRVLRISLISMGGAALLALLLGSLLAHTISRPVRELTAATRAVAAGELGHQVPVRTRDELGELTEAFNHMSRDLEEATRLRRQMTANIAHDLRTPLSSLLGYTEALSEGKFRGSPQIYRTLHQESQHLQRLVDDLRTLSLADAGELTLQMQPVVPRALLERVQLAHAAQAVAQKVTLAITGAETLPGITADEERLVQVLNNLVKNALNHTPEGGQITLGADQVGDSVRFQVADTGSGIPEEELPNIWERLYRGDRARSQTGSSGLGLTIARSIVEAHGGTIAVESKVGMGTTFSVLMPIQRVPPGA